jgi:hypothetical protein
MNKDETVMDKRIGTGKLFWIAIFVGFLILFIAAGAGVYFRKDITNYFDKTNYYAQGQEFKYGDFTFKAVYTTGPLENKQKDCQAEYNRAYKEYNGEGYYKTRFNSNDRYTVAESKAMAGDYAKSACTGENTRQQERITKYTNGDLKLFIKNDSQAIKTLEGGVFQLISTNGDVHDIYCSNCGMKGEVKLGVFTPGILRVTGRQSMEIPKDEQLNLIVTLPDRKPQIIKLNY